MLTLEGTAATKPSLFIVDAMNFLFRAFHALPPLKTTKGTQTGAIYGLCQMILKIEREQKPTHLCVAYDAPGENFRKQIYGNYKAHRPPMPPELAEQLEMVRWVIDAFGLAQVGVPGFEADDVIATLTRIARAAGMDVVICSSDKDLTQLCTDDGGVAILDGAAVIIDQVGMSAGSAYKEGTTLPPLLTSVDRGYERLPGGPSGSGTDTDDNLANFQLLTPSQPENAASACVQATPNATGTWGRIKTIYR